MNGQSRGNTLTATLERAADGKTQFDEFLRRQLGIADASDPALVVGALRKRYPGAATRLDEEAKGFSVRFTEPTPTVAPVTAGCAESAALLRYRQLRPALEADIVSLARHPASRGFEAALDGWRDAVLAELAEGEGAAALAADPASQDRTFYAVRKLGDYARVARLASLLNPELLDEFRRLAFTLDQAGVVLRVLAGEALFRAGFDEGGTVFQVPLQDLRQRREALLGALERFTTESPEEDGDWGMREASYAALLAALDAQGSRELRALLRRDTLARVLDLLLQQVAHQRPELLRGIASTAPLELVQLRRLLMAASRVQSDAGVGDDGGAPAASGPLAAFVQALRLFIDAFADPGAGARLVGLALPAPFASRLESRADSGLEMVRQLFQVRAELALHTEALCADPNGDTLEKRVPAVLDRVLYDLDRCIDLYLTAGAGDFTTPEYQGDDVVSRAREKNALSYGWMLHAYLEDKTRSDLTDDAIPKAARRVLERARNLLVGDPATKGDEPKKPSGWVSFRKEQHALESHWAEAALQLVQPMGGREQLLSHVGRIYVTGKDAGDRPLPVVPDERVSLSQMVQLLWDRLPPSYDEDDPRWGGGGGTSGGGGAPSDGGGGAGRGTLPSSPPPPMGTGAALAAPGSSTAQASSGGSTASASAAPGAPGGGTAQVAVGATKPFPPTPPPWAPTNGHHKRKHKRKHLKARHQRRH